MFVIEREVVVEPAAAQGRYRWPPALPAPAHIAVLAQAVADQPPAQHIATPPGEI